MDMEQISELDENDAPEGYRAVAFPYSPGRDACDACALDSHPNCAIFKQTCVGYTRGDKTWVVFLKREPSPQESFDAGMRKALESMHGSIHTEVTTTPVRPMDSDRPGINRAERIKSLEMAAERVTPEPAKPATPAGLCVVAEQTHRFGGWGA